MAIATNDPARAVPAMATLFNQPSAKLPLGDSVGGEVGAEKDVGGAGGEAEPLGEGVGVVGEVEGGVLGGGVETGVGVGAGVVDGTDFGAGAGAGVDGAGEAAGGGGVGVAVGDGPGACAMHEVANKANIITTFNPAEAISPSPEKYQQERKRKGVRPKTGEYREKRASAILEFPQKHYIYRGG